MRFIDQTALKKLWFNIKVFCDRKMDGDPNIWRVRS